jgi:hypothetical protein
LWHVFKRALLMLQTGETPGFSSLIDSKPTRITTSAASADGDVTASAAPARKKLTELSEKRMFWRQ